MILNILGRWNQWTQTRPSGPPENSRYVIDSAFYKPREITFFSFFKIISADAKTLLGTNRKTELEDTERVYNNGPLRKGDFKTVYVSENSPEGDTYIQGKETPTNILSDINVEDSTFVHIKLSPRWVGYIY